MIIRCCFNAGAIISASAPAFTSIYQPKTGTRPSIVKASAPLGKISVSINEEKSENKDQMTIVAILKKARNVKKGEIIELITTFLPAPGIDTMKTKGYSVWTVKEEDNLIKSYFLKNTD